MRGKHQGLLELMCSLRWRRQRGMASTDGVYQGVLVAVEASQMLLQTEAGRALFQRKWPLVVHL